MKDLLQSSNVKAALWILGAVIVLLLIFSAGITVGRRQAFFGSRFGENYYRDFYGEAPMGMGMGRMPNMHGTVGKVIDVTSSTISVADADGDEHSVAVAPETVIRKNAATIAIGEVKVGDMITVIGGPNESGQIQATFIRVFVGPLPAPPALY